MCAPSRPSRDTDGRERDVVGDWWITDCVARHRARYWRQRSTGTGGVDGRTVLLQRAREYVDAAANTGGDVAGDGAAVEVHRRAVVVDAALAIAPGGSLTLSGDLAVVADSLTLNPDGVRQLVIGTGGATFTFRTR